MVISRFRFTVIIPLKIVFSRKVFNLIAFFKGVDECSKESDRCEYKCHDLKIGHRCSCPEGFELKDDKTSCQGTFIDFAIFLYSIIKSCFPFFFFCEVKILPACPCDQQGELAKINCQFQCSDKQVIHPKKNLS